MTAFLIVLSVISSIAVIVALYRLYKSIIDLKEAEDYYEELFGEKWK